MHASTGFTHRVVAASPNARASGRGRVALGLAFVLASAGWAHTAVKTLQNDGFDPPAIANCQGGAIEGEILAARFTAEPGDYPFRIERVVALVCPDGALPTYMILHVWEDDGSSLQPGTLLYEDAFQVTPSSSAFNVFDLTIQNIVVASGSVRIGLELFHDPWPSVATDDDGNITPQTNFVYASVPPQWFWFYLESFGSAGDWIIRLEIETDPSDFVFGDDFESGDTSEWDQTVP